MLGFRRVLLTGSAIMNSHNSSGFPAQCATTKVPAQPQQVGGKQDQKFNPGNP